MQPAVPSPEEMSRRLFDLWRSGPDPDRALDLARTMPVPGRVDLRGRFHYLTDAFDRDHDHTAFEIEWDLWDTQLRLTLAADEALVHHDLEAARNNARALLETVSDGQHPLPKVDAFIALGDAALQGDEIEQAEAHYDDALSHATVCGYRFGRLRALVGVGHMALRVGTGNQALRTFDEAAALAAELDDRVYRANALAGRGQVLERLRRFDEARDSLEEALELFRSIRSSGGVINTAQHLGDLFRRRGDFDAAASSLTLAFQTSTDVDHWMGRVNAADSLGEVHLALGDAPAAIPYIEIALRAGEQRGDQRVTANALNSLARVAASDGDWKHADTLHRAALEHYRALADPGSSASALHGIARAAIALGNHSVAVDALIEAVLGIESLRSAQDRHRYQQEFRFRFQYVYAAALRAAVVAHDPGAFVTVFEALAGRRLAALVDRVGSLDADVELSGQLLARAHDRPFDGSELTGEAPLVRRARLLGRLANRHALPAVVREDIDEVTAALYQPLPRAESGALLDRVSDRSQVLLVTRVPGTEDLAFLFVDGADRLMRLVAMDADLRRLVDEIACDGLSPTACPSDLDALAPLLPEGVRERISSDCALLIVALDELWSLPWPAIKVSEGVFLGETVALIAAPSLTLADRASIASSRRNRVALWRSPQVRHHELVAYDDDPRVELDRLVDAAHAQTAIVEGGYDLVVVACHGRLAPEIGHYLELDDDVLLTPADLLSAHPPPRLALVACWGAATPGPPDGDPLTLATIAVARGCTAVLATSSEIADDPIASRFVNSILYRLPGTPMCEAVRDATVRLLANSSHRTGYLSRWAPIITVGVPEGDR